MSSAETPLHIVERILQTSLVDRDGAPVEVDLLPAMSESEIDSVEQRLPCRIPPDIRELLLFSRGIRDAVAEFHFVSAEQFGFAELFYYGVELVPDGFGNSWVLDLTPASTEWGPVLFACHDAPVLLFQCDTFAEFLDEWFKLYVPPHTSAVDDVHEDRLFDVWRTNPDVMTYQEALEGDAVLFDFAYELGDRFLFVDLRRALPGQGFSWGRYGSNTLVRRCGAQRIFAYRLPDRTGLARLLRGPYKSVQG